MTASIIRSALAAMAVVCAARPGALAARSFQAADDPALRAAVERFFATQEAEDIPAYLALWSRAAARPEAGQLKYVFDSGDDAFTGISILRVMSSGGRVRVRVAAHRRRTMPRRAGGPPIAIDMDMMVGLTYVREDGGWKLVREGPAADDLAAALLEAGTSAARNALLENDADLLDDGLVTALARRGSTAAQLQQYPQAAQIFERGLEIATIVGDRRAQGDALQNIANALYFMGQYDRALERYAERLAIERERGDEEAVAAALGGIATIRYSFAEYGAALAVYREALAIQDRLGDPAGAATTLISTGNVLYLQGDYESAIADYRRSRDLSRKAYNTEAEARALEGLGRVFTAQGNYAPALAAFRGVLAEGQARSNRRAQGSALQHIGEIHFRLGNVQAARSAFEESRGHYEAIGDQPNVGRVWQGLGLTELVAGRFPAAEQAFGKGITACSGAGDRECVAHALVGLAFAQDSAQKFAEAVVSYGKAVAAFAALGKREEAVRSEVGSSHALLRKGDLDAAHAAAAHARQEALALSSDDLLWRALVADARVLQEKGDAAAALAAARDAVAAAERLQEYAERRPGNSPGADAVSAFATLVVLQARQGDGAAAHATAERMRTFALRATLLPNERDVYRGMTPEERADERTAVAQLIALDAQISRQRSLPRPDAARIEQLSTELADAAARRTEARKRLFDRLPDLRIWRGLLPPPGPSDLDTLLSRTPGAILVEFVTDEDDMVVLSADRGADGVALGAWTLPLTRQWLAERIARLVQPAVLKDAATWKREAGELVLRLPDEFLERLARAQSVVIVPDGPLWRLPFDALPLKDGYLGDGRGVSYAGSIAAAAASWNVPAAPSPSLAAVAAPEVAPAVRDLALLTAPGWTLRPSAAAREEVGRVAAAYSGGDSAPPATILSATDATEAQVRALAATAAVLHIAAPFRINAASPLFSPALLASTRQDDAADDGMLEMREVMNLNVAARTVVLSDGSAATMREALAQTGAIEWAWLASGAPSLVLGRWTAEESATELLAWFHKRIVLGDRGAEALRAAREKARGRAEWAAPYYWAGWMEFGR